MIMIDRSGDTSSAERKRWRWADLGWGTRAVAGWSRIWAGLNLAQQFVACASLVLVPTMLIIGLWVSHRIKESATHRSGVSAALYMENFVEPLVQDLVTRNEISSETAAKLGRLLTETSLGQRVLTFKIWGPDGMVIASSRPELVGQRFIPSEGLKGAWSGRAKAEFDNLKDAENAYERASGVPLLEIYIPLRARGSDKVIAVGEFYEKEPELGAELAQAQLLSWAVVGLVTMSMLSALFAIVQKGSRTIERQHRSLEQRVDELMRLVEENRMLRRRVEQASVRASESTEAYLRRFGADLHDGPAQLISLALMKLGATRIGEFRRLRFALRSAKPEADAGVHNILTTALKDLRSIANGLALPEIEPLTLEETIMLVARRHEKITGTSVEIDCGPLPACVQPHLKVCVYRFVQEGLSNAFRHAGGTGQVVKADLEGDALRLAVLDKGCAPIALLATNSDGLGLKGLAARLESVGGILQFQTQPNVGARLLAVLPLTKDAGQ